MVTEQRSAPVTFQQIGSIPSLTQAQMSAGLPVTSPAIIQGPLLGGIPTEQKLAPITFPQLLTIPGGAQAQASAGIPLTPLNLIPATSSPSSILTPPGTQSFGGNGSTGLGAGQGPGIQSTGQASDNPFNNSFFFQIPQAGAQPSGPTGTPATTGPSGYSQYVPLIIIGVVVAGLGYYLFGRKK